jgi:8-oxo-dGTP diphosphatase
VSNRPRLSVATDVALFTIRDDRLAVLLVQRRSPPFDGAWALPGGFVEEHEPVAEAAARELAEETGIDTVDGHLEQLRTYGDPDRDPRMRVVSVAHVAVAAQPPEPKAGSDAAGARFWAVDDIAANGGPGLAFDHSRILADATEWIRSKLEHTLMATAFCRPPFTIGELRRVYEVVWGERLDAGNFQRKVTGTPGLLVPTEGRATAGAAGGRPAQLFRPGPRTRLHPPILRRSAVDIA